MRRPRIVWACSSSCSAICAASACRPRRSRANSTGAERRNADALQLTFKILINSFYGYLGFSLGHFNDFGEANALTKRGRDLIQRAVAELEEHGAQVIEVDTDGIYFVPPSDAADEKGAERLLEQVGSIMPEGIRLEIDGRYAAMFSYKMKNYVLQDDAGKMTIRGSGLRSRGLERFQRRFMEQMFRLLLEDRRDEIPKLHDEYRARLARHEIGIADLMKTETLQDSLDTYRSKIGDNSRNLAAAYELALKAERPYLRRRPDFVLRHRAPRDCERERVREDGGGVRSATIPTRTSSTTSTSSPTFMKNSGSSSSAPACSCRSWRPTTIRLSSRCSAPRQPNPKNRMPSPRSER